LLLEEDWALKRESVMVKGLRVVVKALMARKNKQPVKYCH
jgi:hypothetical protein